MSATTPAKAGLASVIVPCTGRLDLTRHCVAALARHTRTPWELVAVAVADGPDGATAAYLEGVRDAAPFPVVVVTSPGAGGFAAACGRGLRAARGDHLVLLGHDVVVTDAWLAQLTALADSDAGIGMTGPLSDAAPPPQRVDAVPYTDLEGMHRFAGRWRQEHRGRWKTVDTLWGGCLLVKRRALEAAGGVGEAAGPGLIDDLVARVRQAGYELAVACDLFVHGSGGRTPAGPPMATATAAGRPMVSLTMIVRDEEANLPACLGSARDLFDELVVVDTGSTDRTAEVARGFGARVFDFVWVGDFAAARNAALARARGDYAFWLDADDVFEPHEREKLRALLAGLRHGDEAAYVVRCACDPGPDGRGGDTVVDHVRLFPAREDLRWEYRVHEQILPALRRAGVPVRWSEVTVRHTGYADPALRRRKLERDEAILREELADRPGDPFVLFNLGSIADERQDWRAALGYLTQSLAGSAPSDSITRKLHSLIARSHQRLGDPRAALAACAAGLAAEPDDAELLFRKGVVHRLLGEPAEAEASWRRVLGLRRPERFSSVDAGIYGHVTRRNLAVLVEERGDRIEAARLWSAVLAERPGDAEAARALGRLSPAGGPPP